MSKVIEAVGLSGEVPLTDVAVKLAGWGGNVLQSVLGGLKNHGIEPKKGVFPPLILDVPEANVAVQAMVSSVCNTNKRGGGSLAHHLEDRVGLRGIERLGGVFPGAELSSQRLETEHAAGGVSRSRDWDILNVCFEDNQRRVEFTRLSADSAQLSVMGAEQGDGLLLPLAIPGRNTGNCGGLSPEQLLVIEEVVVALGCLQGLANARPRLENAAFNGNNGTGA